MTEEKKKLSDVEAMTRIKRLMEQLYPADFDLVSRWLCDKYGPAKPPQAHAATVP